MSLISSFRNDFSSGLFAHTKAVWLKYCGAYAIQYVISTAIAIVFLVSLFDWGRIMEIAQDPEEFGRTVQTNPEVLMELFKGGQPDIGMIVGIGGIVFIIMIIISSWMYNVYFSINDRQIRNGNSNLSDVLRSSFNNNVWRILGASLLFGIIAGVLALVTAFSAQLHPLMLIPVGFLMALIGLRLFIVNPAIVHGNLGVMDAYAYSWKYINFRRAALLFLIGIASVIALVIVAALYFLILGLLSLIPILGMIIQIAGSILFSAVIYALIYTAMSGLYFRYSDDPAEGSGMQLEDHLVDD